MIILASAWPCNMALWCVANSQQYIQICAAIWMVGTSQCKHGRGKADTAGICITKAMNRPLAAL